MGSAFQGVVFDGWTEEQLRTVPAVGDAGTPRPKLGDLPAGALQLFTTCRAVPTSYAATIERARTAQG